MNYADLTAEQKTRKIRNNQKYTNKYREKTYDVVSITIRKDGKDGITLEQLKHAAEVTGQSVNKLIVSTLAEHI